MSKFDSEDRADTAFLTGGGALGAQMRVHDWATSPLGDPGSWPQSLRSVVSLLLESQFPMFVGWGPELGLLYNDAYAEILGAKHPAAIGAPFLDVWSEIREELIPLIDTAIAGEAFYREDLPLLLRRKGFDEQTWFTFSYSPVRDRHGRIAGLFCTCTETTGKMLAELHLAGESERLQRMFQQAPGFMAMLRGPDHVFELANASYMRLVGERKVIGIPVRQAFPELEDQTFFEALDHVYATDEAVVFNAMPARLANGADGVIEERFLDLIYQPITGPDGQVTGIFAEGSDVTERVRAELALRESEAQFRGVAEAMPGFVWTADGAGELDYTSNRWLEYSGDIGDEGLGQGWGSFVHPDDRDGAFQTWASSIRTGDLYEKEFRLRRRDGLYRWWLVRAVPVRNDAGEVTRWIGSAADVHAIVEAREVLSRSHHELEQEVDKRTRERDRNWNNSQDLLAIVDMEETVRTVNPAWTKILGWQPDEVVGRKHREFDHLETAGASAGVIDAATGQVVREYESRVRRKDGGWRWISWVATADAGLIYVSGRDVTAQKEQAEALATAHEALRQSQKMEAVGQLTGGIAHDFNNMLAVIVGSLDLLKRRIGVEDARAGRYLHAATDGARRATLLTQRLLAFSRQQPLRPAAIDANKLVAGIADLMRHSLGADIQLETVLAGGLWRTHADPNQLENVILNLAVNARDAMPEGGKLTVETQNTHLDARYVAAEVGLTAGQYVLIAATDTGSGMPPEVIARAFDPFYTTNAVGKGTGLGLSQVYGFVRQSNGHVKIYSEPGEGTTVKIYLPRLAGAMDEPIENDEPTDMPLGELQEVVLVVEDEPAVRQFSVDALRELGYRVLEADGAATALRLLDAHPNIALLFTDVVMPEVNGAKLADEARRRRPELKVLFTTGYTRNAVVHNGVLDAGVELIGKPFTINELALKVREVLDAPPTTSGG